jgi:hypothetical protein
MPFLAHTVLHDTIVLTHMAAGRMQLHARAKAWLSVQPYGQQQQLHSNRHDRLAPGYFACRPPRKIISCRHQHTHMHAGMFPAQCAPCTVRTAAAHAL